MSTQTGGRQNRNWPLVITAILVMIINLAVIIVVSMNVTTVGWWAALIIPAAGSSIGLAVMAIKKNEPAWLLLDLILPN